MTAPHPTIKCKKCGVTFEPDMKTKQAWVCPKCQTKNPNLSRHYRSVADLCILGLIATAAIVAVRLSQAGWKLGVVLSAGHGVLLLVTIIFVYKSKTPWSDSAAKTLIWSVFCLAVLFNVVAPLALAGMAGNPAAVLGAVIPGIVVYAVIFSYLFWLHTQANKCTVEGPRDLPQVVE